MSLERFPSGIATPDPLETLSNETFEKFRTLISEKTSINMRDGKQILVANRLRKRVRALGLGGFDEYFDYLTGPQGERAELPHFIDAVSTNETYFFREPKHFTVLREQILPRLLENRRRIVIWSAGCSTGEEAYSLRILLEESRSTLGSFEAQIIATDIGTRVIERARLGVYAARSVHCVPKELLARYFEPIGVEHRIVEPLRRTVEFRTHNLLHDAPPAERVDLIFCRNVMIYFTKESQRRLVDEYFAEVLSPDGYLCIGHAESLSATSRRFRFVRSFGAPVYRLAEE